MNRRFYTLNELIFTIGVVALLLLSSSTLISNEQGNTMKTHCLNNLKASAAAMAAYAADNNGYYLLYKHNKETYQKKQSHVTWGFWMTSSGYLQDARHLVCPAGEPDGVSKQNNRFQLNTYGALVASEIMPYYRGSQDRNYRCILGAKTTPDKTIMLIDSLDLKNFKQSYNYQFRSRSGSVAQQRHDIHINLADFSGAAKSLTPEEWAADLAVDCRRTSVKPKQVFYADDNGRVQSQTIKY